MTGFTAVLLYIVWMIALVLVYAGPRIPLAAFTERRMDSWERTKTPTDPAFFLRAKGAHLNCVENFPLFAAIVCVAALMGKSAVVDGLAAYVLYLRLAQGVTHLIGDSSALVLIRATFFAGQTGLMLYMVWGLTH
jgi:uncharacterized MAPEG superfamily protein